MEIATMNFLLREPVSEADWDQYFDLRWRVLRGPWGQPRGSERVDGDEHAWHVMAWAMEPPPACLVGVGCLILTAPGEARVRCMAVEPAWQSRGVGRAIMEQLERDARQLNLRRLTLQSREPALGFYLKLGYRNEGPSFVQFGTIQHYLMSKDLQ